LRAFAVTEEEWFALATIAKQLTWFNIKNMVTK
jgi:hypothetical protein